MKRILRGIVYLYIIMSCGVVGAQKQPLLSPVAMDSTHPFIRYKANTLHIASDSTLLSEFFSKWNQVLTTGQGNVHIVHIGGSHVQAGTLPNRIRRNLLLSSPEYVADRGMVFPYSAAAKCNNPPDYRVHCPQRMELTRNVYKTLEAELGLCGIAVTARDTSTFIDIVMAEQDIDYANSRIVVLGYSPDHVVPFLQTENGTYRPSHIEAGTRRFLFNLPTTTDSFRIVLPCEQGQSFVLTGVYLGNQRAGLSYHSIGVNGAAVPDYLKCNYLKTDLRMMKPDMVVFGIGINDASGPNFDSAAFFRNYMQLVDSIREVSPRCAFVFITNNDSYRRVKRNTYSVNRNGLQVQQVCYRLAEATGGAVWDQFEVMGGLKSMDKWRVAKLAQNDRVHFTRAGYLLVGDLFYNALASAANHFASCGALESKPTRINGKRNVNDERSDYLSY